MDIGKRIAAARHEAGLTQSALALAAGTEAMTISRYERGAMQPSVEALTKIATALNVTMDHLAGRELTAESA